jgi:hypothetical protein
MTAGEPSLPAGVRPGPRLVRLVLWFRGYAMQVAWMVVALGTALLWTYTPWTDLHGLRGPLATSKETRVLDKWNASVSLDGIDLFGYQYSFYASDGSMHAGLCFGPIGIAELGQGGTVEYVAGNPRISRLAGGRAATNGHPDALAAALGALGGVFLAGGALRRLRVGPLLRQGTLAEAKIISRSWPGAKEKLIDLLMIRNPELYRITAEFRLPDGGVRHARCRTFEPQDPASARPLQVLYDPTGRRGELILQSLPGAPFIDAQGRMRLKSQGRAIKRLVIPAAAMIALVLYAFWRYAV